MSASNHIFLHRRPSEAASALEVTTKIMKTALDLTPNELALEKYGAIKKKNTVLLRIRDIKRKHLVLSVINLTNNKRFLND